MIANDLISREALKAAIIELTQYSTVKSEIDKELLMEIIDELPAADAVEIVRCADCEYGEFMENEYQFCLHSEGIDERIYPHNYCGYGKRRSKKRGCE